MNKKIFIIDSIAVILIVILCIVRINMGKKNGSNIVSSPNTDAVIDPGRPMNPISTKKSNANFEIYNTDITTDTGSTRFTATVKNISGAKTEEQRIEIGLLNSNGVEIGTMTVVIPSLENEVATKISAESLTVFEGIYDFIIK